MGATFLLCLNMWAFKKDLFTVLLNECFENECYFFILDHGFVSFATYYSGRKKPLWLQ